MTPDNPTFAMREAAAVMALSQIDHDNCRCDACNALQCAAASIRALPLPEQQVTEAMQPFIKRAAAFKDYNRSDDFTVSVRLGDLKALHRATALSHKDSSND